MNSHCCAVATLYYRQSLTKKRVRVSLLSYFVGLDRKEVCRWSNSHKDRNQVTTVNRQDLQPVHGCHMLAAFYKYHIKTRDVVGTATFFGTS